MSKESVVARAENFEILISDTFSMPRLTEGALVAPLWMLRLDLQHGIFGDALAGAFLLHHDHISSELLPLVSSYRASVLAEERRLMVDFFGDVFPLLSVDKRALIILRMLRLWRRFGKIYRECLERPGALAYVDDLEIGKERTLYRSVWGGRQDEEALDKLMELSKKMGLIVTRGPIETEIGLSARAMSRVEALLGKGASCKRTGLIYSTYICEGDRRKAVVKDYNVSAVKWIPATLASAPMSRYRTDPRERAVAEVLYSTVLRGLVRTPKIFFLGLGRDVMAIREYISGVPLLLDQRQDSWERCGEALARIHNAGYALGDANPGNFVVSEEISVIDLEQTRAAGEREKLWDLITLLMYSALVNIRCKLIESFMESYLSSIRSPILAREVEIIERLAPCGAVPPRFPDIVEFIKKRFS